MTDLPLSVGRHTAEHAGTNGGSSGDYLENAPAALAVVSGIEDIFLYANAAFRALVAPVGEALIGRPARDVFAARNSDSMSALLARVREEGATARGEFVLKATDATTWSCTVWPGGGADQVVLQLDEPTETSDMIVRRREIAERLVLSALREHALAEIAEAARRRAAFLSDASGSLSSSIEREPTYATLAKLSLLTSGTWCIVDIIESNGSMRRLGILHNDPERKALAGELDGHWLPEPDDPIGAPLALRLRKTVIIDRDVQSVLAEAAHSSENLRILERLDVGSLLVVPLMNNDFLLGAITFICGPDGSGFSPDEVEVAERLAARCALALHNAHLYELATGARERAEIAHSEARVSLLEAQKISIDKTELLNHMAHELRTPLNAIAGYTELLVDGVYGQLTDVQMEPIRRIQKSEQHLVHLTNGVLALARRDSGIDRHTDVQLVDLFADIALMLEPKIRQKGIRLEVALPDDPVVLRADRQGLIQIMLNVIANAIKFTPRGGKITLSVADSPAGPGTIALHVRDTGIGIARGKLQEIFEPFVQAHPADGEDQGTGLGLSISRDFARRMGGDISAESTVGEGSVFIVTLPRAMP